MNSTSQCTIFHELSRNVEYHIIVAIKGAFCLIGAVRVAQQWQTYGVRFLVHENTKILFRFYYALNIILSSIFGCIYLCELIRLRFDCMLFDFRYILLTRCVGISTIFTAQYVILIISFERLYSTIFPAHFEKNSSKRLAVSLALTVTVSSYVFSMMKMSDNFQLFQARKVALLNERQPENREGFETLMTAMAFGNCLSLVMLPLDLYLNFIRKGQPKTSTSLGVSYQLSENRRIILTLLPIELTQTLIGLFSSTALVIHGKFIPTPTPIGQQLFLELVTFTTFFPLIITFFIKYSVEKKMNRSPPIDPEVDHFASLRRSWEI